MIALTLLSVLMYYTEGSCILTENVLYCSKDVNAMELHNADAESLTFHNVKNFPCVTTDQLLLHLPRLTVIEVSDSTPLCSCLTNEGVRCNIILSGCEEHTHPGNHHPQNPRVCYHNNHGAHISRLSERKQTLSSAQNHYHAGEFGNLNRSNHGPTISPCSAHKQGFHFPLFMMTCHYIVKFLLAFCGRRLLALRGGNAHERVLLQWDDFVYRLAPVGIAATVDIALSTWSLEFISVTLYTMSKSTVIVFILLFAVILGLEKPHCSLCIIVLAISGGLCLFTYKSTQFDATGFALIELAALCSGVRWCLCQSVMQRKNIGLENPLDMIYHVQPWMIIGILPLLFIFEGSAISLSSLLLDYRSPSKMSHITLAVLVGGLLAFAMEVTEYGLLTNSSSLTLSIVGIVKEIATLYLGQHYGSGGALSSVNLAGLFVCMGGVVLHLGLKIRRARAENKKNVIAELAESLNE